MKNKYQRMISLMRQILKKMNVPLFLHSKSKHTFSELLKINHNFVKPHEGLDNKTPAQAAKIDLSLGADKYLDLIKQAGTKPNFVNNLGKRIKKVEIINEGDSIKVTTKT